MGKTKIRKIVIGGQVFHWRYKENYCIHKKMSVQEWLHLRNTLPAKAQDAHPLMHLKGNAVNLGRLFFCEADNKNHRVVVWLKTLYHLRETDFNPHLPSITSQIIQFFLEKHIDFEAKPNNEFPNGMELLLESTLAEKYALVQYWA